jgi:hypothetical protein
VDYVKPHGPARAQTIAGGRAALKGQASSDAAGPERVPGAGAEAAATSDWVTRVTQVKPGA